MAHDAIFRSFLLAAFLAATSCSAPAEAADEARELDAFPAPMMASQHENGLCGRVVAVSGDGRVWAERGCENGAIVLRPTGRVATAAELARIEAAFGALPAGEGCPGASKTGSSESVVLHRRNGGARKWTGCVSGDALASPWAEADAAVAAVAPWPLSL